jgi:hypothetical protein
VRIAVLWCSCRRQLLPRLSSPAFDWRSYNMTHILQNDLCTDIKRSIDLETTRCPKVQPLNRTRIFETHHIEKLLLDISAHICPKRFIKELQYVFPNCDLTDVIAIPTMQFAKNELVNIGDEIEVEKDRLLERVSPSNRTYPAITQK